MHGNEPNHLRRVAIWGIVLAIIVTPLMVIFLSSSMPPGNATNASSGQAYDNTVLISIVTPIAALLIVYFVYALVVFRYREDGPAEGVAIAGNRRVDVLWLVITSAIVFFAAIFGTVELANAGSGGGEGASPAWKPSRSVPTMPVQVIAQQWEFTYRYPTFGGIETAHIELPVGQEIALHVTSLDVIHSWWSPKLAVKADANPGVDNVAYFAPRKIGNFDLRCSELCGLWHGYMFDTGRVVPRSEFLRWIHHQQQVFGQADKTLPRYSNHYFPEPLRRGG